MPQKVVGISSMATRPILADLIPGYTNKTGQDVKIEAVGGVDAARRIRSGEAFDIIVLADDVVEKLESEGLVEPASRAPFARSPMAVAVRAGAKKPDIGDEQSVKAAVLAARSVCCSTGPSGTHLIHLLKKWGVYDEVSKRLVQAPPGTPVGSLIAKGTAELGFQQVSELMHERGIEIVGPLPSSIQSVTTFSLGVGKSCRDREAVGKLIAYLTSDATAEAKRRNGMEPA